MTDWKKNTKWLYALLLAAVLLPVPTSSALADLGPKPSMEFDFVWEVEQVEIVGGLMLECDQPDCSDGEPLEEGGPQGFFCDSDDCDSQSYGYADYHQITIEFEDRSRTSNVFETAGFDSVYRLTVRENDLLIEEISGSAAPTPFIDNKGASETSAGSRNSCLPGFAGTLILETLFAGIYLAAFGLPRQALGWVPLASLVTLPFVWFAFPQLPVSSHAVVALSETFAVGVESLFLIAAAHHWLPTRHAVLLSVVMNAASFLAGWFFL